MIKSVSKFDQFKNKMKGKRVTVIGIGISNKPLITLLHQCGAKIHVCDKASKDKLGSDLIESLEQIGATYSLGEDYLSNLSGDYIFRTPGLRPDKPELISAIKNGSVMTSEMECFFEVCPCPIIAVTGSDGKTTTTTLISKIAQASGVTCHIGGNIGTPLLSQTDKIRENDIAVVELSSFQLFTMKKSPSVAVITNLSPNHLDIHTDMEEYTRAKENIFLYQNADDLLVLNADNQYTDRFIKKAKGRIVLFSGKNRLNDGYFADKDNFITYRHGGKEQKILNISDIFIPGKHNVENYMAAIAATAEMFGTGSVTQVAKTFHGVEHRIEYVKTVNGVKYYNDSIASSPTRTIAGLKSFDQPVILIAGGYDKHIPFDSLGCEIVNCVKLLILTGDTSDKIEKAVRSADNFSEGKLQILRCDTLADAVSQAHAHAESGDIVTMSPACASFDRYKNFEQRGNLFKKLVLDL